jgi:hypothetical protein
VKYSLYCDGSLPFSPFVDVQSSRLIFAYCSGIDVEVVHLFDCRMPITVYMTEKKTRRGLIAIAEYGQEYSNIDPIQVLYHGFGHYEALQIPSNKANSKL